MNENRDKPGSDGTVRKAHYGAGRQPWDDIVDQGWGDAFAAGNVLKYLRRGKDIEHSVESARWYYRQLRERSGWHETLLSLESILTNAELETLRSS